MLLFTLAVATGQQGIGRDAEVVATNLACQPVLRGAGADETDVVRRYAPVVYFAKKERHFPMDPCAFVKSSRLKWARALCTDTQVVGKGALSAAGLGIGAIRYRVPTCFGGRATGPWYSTSHLTAPASKKHSGHRPAGREEGFFLDLDNGARPGVVPADRSYSNAPPLYYEHRPGKYVVYHFFHGFNGRAADKHEGDWERIVVRLDRRDRATHVAYYQHACDPFSPKTAYGVISWKEMRRAGYLADGTHPVVYSAFEAHASYPKHVGTRWLPCGKGGFFDRTGTHTRWETWKGVLANAAHQVWFGYGGGWGARGPSIGWGPRGPLAFAASVHKSWR
jgi:hypothetical protein